MASQQIILITGGNTGLGLETVRALRNSPKPYHIIIGSRSVDKANAAIRELEGEKTEGGPTELSAVQVDLEDDDSINKAFEHVKSKFGKLDVLVNNGGASYDQAYMRGEISLRDSFNKAWNTNTTGTHILTMTLVPLLLASSTPRIVFVTSGLSSLTEQSTITDFHANKPPEKGWPKTGPMLTGYRSSKTGMNMMYREWAKTLHNDGVKVMCVSPGLLATGLGGDPEMLKKIGAAPASEGAERMRKAMEGEREDALGKVLRRDGLQPW